MNKGVLATTVIHSPAAGEPAFGRYRGRVEADGGPLAMIDHPIHGFLAVPLEEVVCHSATASRVAAHRGGAVALS